MHYCFGCIDLEDAEQVAERQLKRMDYTLLEMANMIRHSQLESRARKKAMVEAVVAEYWSRCFEMRTRSHHKVIGCSHVPCVSRIVFV